MRHRLAVILPTFLAIYVACYDTAFLLRCDFDIPPEVMEWFWTTLPVVIALKFFGVHVHGRMAADVPLCVPAGHAVGRDRGDDLGGGDFSGEHCPLPVRFCTRFLVR